MKKLPYRIVTGLVALVIFGSGLTDVMAGKEIIEGMAQLGYPKYFVILIGVWKILGAIAISVPGFDRVKEWAYAGIMFDVSGALVSHIARDEVTSHMIMPAALVVLTAASYVLRMRVVEAGIPSPSGRGGAIDGNGRDNPVAISN